MPVRHVLVVDDSKSARLMLRKMLQGFGLTVDTVDSAEEALNYLRGQRPDAIFMDHTMPGLDGLAAVRQIKGDPVIAAIPVTMYTSKDEPAYQDEARAAGAMGVLIKPATPDALSAVLEQMNVLFDAAAALIASAPPPTPAPPPAAEAVTTEQFEKLAFEKAEMVVYDAIESQVLPLINDVIAKVRRDLEAGQEEACSRIAARICEARLAQWQPPTSDPSEARAAAEAAVRTQLPLLEERLAVFQREERAEIERQAREVAGQIYQGQFHELSERLVRQLSARFAEATQKAGEVAREAAREAALQTITETAAADAGEEGSQAVAARQAFHQLWEVARRDVQRRIYLAAGWAAALGIGAAALVYGLR